MPDSAKSIEVLQVHQVLQLEWYQRFSAFKQFFQQYLLKY